MSTKKQNQNTVGKFSESLKRSGQKINHDRAASIFEDAKITYQRKVEDIELSIKRMTISRNNMLDFSPNTPYGIMSGGNFNSKDYVHNDLEITINIMNAEIALSIAKKRFEDLFGGYSNATN